MSVVYPYVGMALTHQKITPGDTVTGLSTDCRIYKEYFLNVSGVDAGSTIPTAGQWIVGAAGGTGCVLSVVLNSGAWGNANARATLRIKSFNGTAFVATENVAIGANANHFTIPNPMVIIACSAGYKYDGMVATSALVTVYANTALVSFDGSTPDQTSLIGHDMAAGTSMILADANEIKNFKCVDYVSASASVVQVTFRF